LGVDHAVSDGTNKRCSMCGETKGVQDFARCSTSRDGLYSRCRTCSNAASRAYAATNRDRIIERQRRYRASNPEQVRARQQAWYQANRSQALEAAAAYRHEHADEIRDKQREYRRTHADARRRSWAAYYSAHREQLGVARREWYRQNRKDVLQQAMLYRAANADALKEARARWFAAHPTYKSGYYEQNKHRWRDYGRRSRLLRQQVDPARYSLDGRISRALRKALGTSKAGRSSFALLGYTREQLLAHLEARFLSGMTWDNMAEWHIDHVVPKSWFRYESAEDPVFRECWALDNLQPLWGRDNLSKGNRRSG
jgi:hypothetical protein